MANKTNDQRWSTQDLIAWDELQSRLDGTRAVSADEYIRLLIEFANGRGLTTEEISQLIGVDPRKESGLSGLLPNQDFHKWREWLATTLDWIVDHPNRHPQLLTGADTRASRHVLIAPTFTRQGRKDRIITSGPSGAMVYGIELLLDKFPNRLCRCEYTKCRAFFLKRRASGGGRGAPVRKYCSEEHYTLGDREKAAERMRRARR